MTRPIGIALLLAAASMAFAQPDRMRSKIDESARVRLSGPFHAPSKMVEDLGIADSNFPLLKLTLSIRPSASQQAALQQLVQDQENPSSPHYHRWLSPEEFAGQFGLSTGDAAQIVTWLRAYGFTADPVSRSRTFLTFSGSAGMVQKAFGTSIHRYRYNSQIRYANANEVTIPAAVSSLVAGIRGLNDFHARPGIATARPDWTLSPLNHLLAPDDFAAVYDIAPLYAAGTTGAGQEIAILGQSEISANDIGAFWNMFGLTSAKLVEVQVPQENPGVSQGDVDESTLDVEWAGAVARDAAIVFVYSYDVWDSATYAVDNDVAPVIAMSYGQCEVDVLAELPFYHQLVLQANAEGITWLAASGDNGATGCDAGTVAQGGLAVDEPGSMPEVTAVGGTSLSNVGPYWNNGNTVTQESATGYIPETAWNESLLRGSILATGGGASAYFPQPSWQANVVAPPDGWRHVPDISFNASVLGVPYYVYCSLCLAATDGVEYMGGTGAGASTMAGVVALLNQYLGSNGLGNINPALYNLFQTAPEAFHNDIAGNNIVPCADGSPGCNNGQEGLTATGSGYSSVVGFGSVDVAKLVQRWSSVAPAGAVVSVSLDQNPVYQGNPENCGIASSWNFQFTLTEEAGFATTVTGLTVNGVAAQLGSILSTSAIGARASIGGCLALTSLTPPADETFVFSGPGWNTPITVAVQGYQAPTLSIASSHAGDFGPGQTGAIYTVTVRNVAAALPTSGTVTVTESVPAGITLVTMAGSGWNCPASSNTCDRSDPLAAGASYPAITVTVYVAEDAPPLVTNRVSASGGGSVPASASDPTVVPQPVLTIAQSHTGSFSQGQTGATYTVTVDNGSLRSQPSLVVPDTSLPIGSASCNDFDNFTVTSSDGSNLAFTVAVQYPNGNQFNWLYADLTYGGGATSNGTPFTANTATSGVSLTVGLNYRLAANSATASLVLTPTGNPGSPTYITVYYSQNFSCGGNTGSAGNGFISVSPGTIALSAPADGQQSQIVTVQNTGADSYGFQLTLLPANSWLSVSANSATLIAGGSTSVTVTGTGSQAGPGNYTGAILFTPLSGYPGAAIMVPLTFLVSNSGAGTLTVNGATDLAYTASFNYIVPSAPSAQCIAIQDTAPGASGYTSTVTTLNGGNWLLANNSLSVFTPQLLTPGYGACVTLDLNPAVAFGLSSGAYQGTVSLTSTSGATATIGVNYYVSAGAGSGVTVMAQGQSTPGQIYVFPNVAANSSVVQQEAFSIGGASGVALGTAILNTGAGVFTMTAPAIANSSETFTVTSNSTGLATGLYAATVTMTSTRNNQTGATTITMVQPVGQAGGTVTATGSSSASANTSTTGTVTVTEHVPAGLTLVSMAGSGWACPHGGATCTRSDSLAAGAAYPAITVTANVANDAPALLTNQVSVAGGGSAPADASDETIVLPAVLAVAMTHAGDFTQGQTGATYSVNVSNASASIAPSGTVTMTESVPNGLVLASMSGDGWTCPSGGSTCSRSDSLPAGMSYPAITVTVNVLKSAPASLTNVVNVSGGASASSASDLTTVKSPCDISQYGSITIADMQAMVNGALGIGTPHDADGDGTAGIVDVQIVINGALGLSCFAQ